jgi:hypothetical protein
VTGGRRRSAALSAIVAGALALASCGGGSDETTATEQLTPSKQSRAIAAQLANGLSGEERAAALATGYYLGAYEEGDLKDVCLLTSRSSSLYSGCRDLSVPYPPSPLPAFVRDRIGVEGREAKLHLIFPKRQDLDLSVTLERVGEDWKVVTANYRISRLPKQG